MQRNFSVFLLKWSHVASSVLHIQEVFTCQCCNTNMTNLSLLGSSRTEASTASMIMRRLPFTT